MKSITITFMLFAAILMFNITDSFAQEEEIIEENEQINEETQPKKEAQKNKNEEEVIKESIDTEIQEKDELKKSAIELYYKKKYEKTYNYPFEIVWQAIKKSLEDKYCQISYEKYSQTDNGLYKGSLHSDFCVFSAGRDTTFVTLKKFSYEVPFIRGGIWLNGRMQYKFKLTENDDGSVYVLLKGEISGFEDFVTHKVHFWKSNGFFETKMLEAIEKNCKILNE